MTKWEYRVHSCPVAEYWGTLEVFGAQGSALSPQRGTAARPAGGLDQADAHAFRAHIRAPGGAALDARATGKGVDMNLELVGGIVGILVAGFGGFVSGLEAGRDMTRAKDRARSTASSSTISNIGSNNICACAGGTRRSPYPDRSGSESQQEGDCRSSKERGGARTDDHGSRTAFGLADTVRDPHCPLGRRSVLSLCLEKFDIM